MGIIYRAEQRSLGRVVALKVIRPEISATGDYRARFLREAQLAAAVNHPHVVSVHDVGEDAGRLYLIMQWVDGTDLRKLLDRYGRLAPSRAVRVGAQLAHALGAVHEVGLVHRDVKPSNALVSDIDAQEHAYLTDFGIAKMPERGDDLTRTGWMLGTTGYLSPEQIQGRQAEPRSDLYALGCVMFEALTGQHPFGGENDLAVRWAHANSPRPTASAACPDLDTRYDAFFTRALAIDPRERFPTGSAFAEALLAAHAGRPGGRTPQPPDSGPATQVRHHPPTAGATGPRTQTPVRDGRAGPGGPTARQTPGGPTGPGQAATSTVTGAAGHGARSRGGPPAAARVAQVILLTSCLAFLASVTLLTDYVDNGTGGKSLLQATSNDPVSPLYPIDFRAVTALAAGVLVVTLISLGAWRRPLMTLATAASIALTGYTLHISREGNSPGFGPYGPGFWLSLSGAIVMVFTAGTAATMRSGG
jgi:serine/threonine-protein kinase